MKDNDHQNTHRTTHEFLMALAKFPPLTRKSVRNKYRDLVKAWRHDRVLYLYGDLVAEAQMYREKSHGDPVNAHFFYFDKNKEQEPENYSY